MQSLAALPEPGPPPGKTEGLGDLDLESIMPPVDAFLIKSIEMGDLAGTREALAAGADPNARKTVVLGCTVYGETQTTKSWFKGEVKEKGKGTRAIRYRAVHGESALALAVLGDSVEAADLLIRYGANPNLPVEWHIIRSRDVWTNELWQEVVEEGRWDVTMTAANALDLAVGKLEATDAKGERATVVQLLANKGELWINKEGGLVTLINPAADETFQTLRTAIDRDVVDLLIFSGARVTDGARDIAGISQNYGLIEVLESAAARQAQGLDASNSPISESVSTGETMNSLTSSSKNGYESSRSGKGSAVRFTDNLEEHYFR
ncbi:hypothetical protein HDU93_004642 [Gonapodya sp. JEL0774]|nr:hypothetical protein HDU93_004642 [Gonapodya sp. JEL0774]